MGYFLGSPDNFAPAMSSALGVVICKPYMYECVFTGVCMCVVWSVCNNAYLLPNTWKILDLDY